jgi:hypothetical protein
MLGRVTSSEFSKAIAAFRENEQRSCRSTLARLEKPMLVF